MPLQIIDSQILALEKRMQELMAESAALEAELERLKTERRAVAAIDPTRILAAADPAEKPLGIHGGE